MHKLWALSIAISGSASAQLTPYAPQSQAPPPAWQPSAAYVTAGQDEPGYRSWYMALPSRAVAVGHFNNYLKTYGVADVVPTWQLLRTASYWHRCGAQPFEVAPLAEWPNIVQTLRYVRDRVIPTIGPVEVYCQKVWKPQPFGSPPGADAYRAIHSGFVLPKPPLLPVQVVHQSVVV